MVYTLFKCVLMLMNTHTHRKLMSLPADMTTPQECSWALLISCELLHYYSLVKCLFIPLPSQSQLTEHTYVIQQSGPRLGIVLHSQYSSPGAREGVFSPRSSDASSVLLLHLSHCKPLHCPGMKQEPDSLGNGQHGG